MQNATALQLVFTGLMGLLFLAAGYRSMRVTSRLFSGLLFAAIGMGIARHYHVPGWGVLGAAVGGAVLGYLLGNLYYYVNMAVTGAAAGFVLTAIASALVGGEVNLVLALIAGVVGAFAGVVFERGIGIAATSVLGGALLMATAKAAAALAQLHAPNRYAAAYAALFAGLAALGCFIQAKTSKNLPAKGASAPAKK